MKHAREVGIRLRGKRGTRRSVVLLVLVGLLVQGLVGLPPAKAEVGSAGASSTVDQPRTGNRTTQLNRRFTHNPYVPPLVYGSQIDEAKNNFICPKEMIFGFRGSGEGPEEFKVKDPGVLNTKGQTYSNWDPQKGFTVGKVYSSDNYLKAGQQTSGNDALDFMDEDDLKFYNAVFGKTVGPMVLLYRRTLARYYSKKRKDIPELSNIGIWSVGVDDLHFSTETMPQSVYHAADVAILNTKRREAYIELVKNTFKSLEGFATNAPIKEGKYLPLEPFGPDAVTTTTLKGTPVTQISNFYYALLLLKKFCPELLGVHLVGYSQGAIIARFVASRLVIEELAPSRQLVKATALTSGLARQSNNSLLLIADPLFDGAVCRVPKVMKNDICQSYLPELMQPSFRTGAWGDAEKEELRLIGKMSKAKGMLVRFKEFECVPHFNVDVKQCKNFGVSASAPALRKTFYIVSVCKEDDIVCAPGVDLPVFAIVDPAVIAIKVIKDIKDLLFGTSVHSSGYKLKVNGGAVEVVRYFNPVMIWVWDALDIRS